MIVQIKHKTGNHLQPQPLCSMDAAGESSSVRREVGLRPSNIPGAWRCLVLQHRDAKESSMRKARVQLDDSERHKGSGTAESCVPAPGITGQVFHGSCEMTSSGRTFKHHPSSCHFSACGLLSLPPPPPPRLIHKDFLIPIKLSETK